jgi:hypothetical protein
MGGRGSTRWRAHSPAPTVDDALEELPATTCPRCGRRCRAVYRMAADGSLACRICHGLTYRSSQASHRLDAAAADMAKRWGFAVSPKELAEALGDQADAYLASRGRRAHGA